MGFALPVMGIAGAGLCDGAHKSRHDRRSGPLTRLSIPYNAISRQWAIDCWFAISPWGMCGNDIGFAALRRTIIRHSDRFYFECTAGQFCSERQSVSNMWLESRGNARFPLGQILPSRRSIAQGRSSSCTRKTEAMLSTRAAYAHALFRAGR